MRLRTLMSVGLMLLPALAARLWTQKLDTAIALAALIGAASAYVGESVRNPGLYYDNNVGGMTALLDAARLAGVGEIVDPSPHAVGSLVGTYAKYPNAVGVLPAMGYGEAQIRDLEATIEAADCDAVVSGTPIDLTRVLKVSKPMTRARYDLREREPGVLRAAVERLLV